MKNIIVITVAVLITIVSISIAAEEPNPKIDYVAKINELEKQDRDEKLNASPSSRMLVTPPIINQL